MLHALHAPLADNLKQQAYAHAQAEQFYEAVALYTQLYQDNPHDVQSAFQAGVCLLKIGNIQDAISLYTAVAQKIVDPLPALYNIGFAHKNGGNLTAAITMYKKILEIDPAHDGAHLALGFAYLNQGDFERGWQQHERYLKKSGKNADALRVLIKNGTVTGKRILLQYEGGLGDTLMFIRYAQRLHTMGAHATCFVQKNLVPLLSLCPYIDIVETDKKNHQSYDAWASLMSLPAVFNDTEKTFPCAVPYLHADPQLTEQWALRVAPFPGLKIGLCWQSDVHNDISRLPIARRGMPLACWHSLLQDTGKTVFSLQRFDGTEQIKDLPDTCNLQVFEDMDTAHGSFMDTAALMTQLDLIITIDSAVAHLAGALGKQTILLVPYVPDWRWIYNRTDSPWYPTMHIFKQTVPFDWQPTVAEVYRYLSMTE
jgi:tetratricopeptide (TPR) repeat protein